MSKDSSASTRKQTPHANRTTRTNTIINALKQRAESVLNDDSLDACATLRKAMERNDPWLAKLVRQADAGEAVGDSEMSSGCEVSSIEDKIKALTDIICCGGEEPTAALLVLMSTLVNATDPKALANLAKHLAFTRCGELNVNGMVEAQIAVIERELFAGM